MTALQTTLFEVLILLCATAVLGWLVLALVMKLVPAASWRFALGNSSLMVGVMMLLLRGGDPSPWLWLCSDFLVISAFVLVRSGVQALFALPASRLEHSLVLGLYGLGLLVLGAGPRQQIPLGVWFSLAAFYVFTRLLMEIFQASRQWFKPGIALWINWPFVMLCLFMLVRLLMLLTAGRPGQPPPDDTSSTWFYLLLFLLLNLSLIGCAMGQLLSRIRMLADQDPLTGLANRRVFNQHFQAQQGGDFALILFDLDDFKLLNDNHGHQLGDLALEHVARLLEGELRHQDTFTRQGGEEFAILLPGLGLEEGRRVAERLKDKLKAHPLNHAGQPIPVTASFGVVSSRDAPFPHLYHLADQAMYRAKQAGKCQVAAKLAP
ncbi:GGDEF domain-containing protein [Gallaecimonas kandeliae]|uniref:sensor domain-containing diguanylate cyclase n=1 Tax=Gallaecimonas kandeliae TaxID=3029055 RepID=UPI002647EBCF|nr:GGDEF domain-containing protein [Gallaecimonas kandeliae]WKE66396.1 GGDEF domain-containing protein [Gallaecimonas kandeliae]